MHWQDLVFTIGSICFSVALIPMLRRDADRPPVFSSAMTGFWLYAYGGVFLTLSLTFSAVTSIINATIWSAIGILKWYEPRRRKNLARELSESWDLTIAERTHPEFGSQWPEDD